MKERLSKKSYTNVWCLTDSYSEDKNVKSDNNLRSQLALSMAHPNDYILIHGDRNKTFITYYVEKYHLKSENILFTHGIEKNMDIDIYKHCLNQLVENLKNIKYIRLIPRRVSESFLKWVYVLREKMPFAEISYFGDTLDWQSVLGSKKILHPRINKYKVMNINIAVIVIS